MSCPVLIAEILLSTLLSSCLLREARHYCRGPTFCQCPPDNGIIPVLRHFPLPKPFHQKYILVMYQRCTLIFTGWCLPTSGADTLLSKRLYWPMSVSLSKITLAAAPFRRRFCRRWKPSCSDALCRAPCYVVPILSATNGPCPCSAVFCLAS